MPKISVIIPLYKVENYLKDCLNSVVNQTLDDIEIICVDDGSPDSSGDIAEQYAKRYDNILVIRKENGGQSSARNVALENAKGKYIYFLDSDDYLEKDTLKELYTKAEDEQLEMVYFNAIPFFENEQIKNDHIDYVKFYNREGEYSGVYTGQSMFTQMCKNGEFFGSPCLEIFKRNLIEENGLRFYNGIIHEDNLFTFQCTMLAKRVGYINKCFYHRRLHEESTMTKKKSMKNVEGYIVSCAEMTAFMRNIEIEKSAVSTISEYIYNIYLNAYNIYNSLDLDENVKLSKGDFYAMQLFEMIKQKSRDEKKSRKQINNRAKNIIFRLAKKGVSFWGKIKRKLIEIQINGKNYVNPFRFFKIRAYQKKGGTEPLVSIIMPVYNVERYIEQAMDSLIAQTMRHIEIIVVDDGSTDSSLQILNEYASKDNRVKVFKQKNQYAGAARNVGIENAKGEYLIFLDSDDFFSENLVKEAYFAAKMQEADIVLFGGRCFDNNTGEYRDAKWLLDLDFVPKKPTFCYKDCPEKLYNITTPCPWTKMFRRQFILESKLLFQKIQNANDLYFVFSALAMAKRITVLDKTLVNYRVGLATSLQATKKKNPLCFYEAYKAWHDKLQEMGVLDELHKSYANETLSGCLFNLRSISDISAKKVVFERIKNEALDRLELLGYEESYYDSREEYNEMILIRDNDFEKYMELRTL